MPVLTLKGLLLLIESFLLPEFIHVSTTSCSSSPFHRLCSSVTGTRAHLLGHSLSGVVVDEVTVFLFLNQPFSHRFQLSDSSLSLEFHHLGLEEAFLGVYLLSREGNSQEGH